MVEPGPNPEAPAASEPDVPALRVEGLRRENELVTRTHVQPFPGLRVEHPGVKTMDRIAVDGTENGHTSGGGAVILIEFPVAETDAKSVAVLVSEPKSRVDTLRR